ncbi:MAG TPA: hypothetical protein VFR38_13055 [Gaiellaceae bacterium]|nr:hypothetical protein [Gaiellaceae bacterium]
MTHTHRPLTERVLARLGDPRAAWIAAWGSVPWLNAGANLLLGTKRTSAVWEQSDALVALNYAAISLAIAVSLWGTGRIARRLEALRTSRSATLEGEQREHFRGMNSTVGPIAASGVAALLFGVSTLVTDGWMPAILRGATWFVIGIALFTYLWTYGCLLLGLNRLGRERLVPDPVHVDPGLGLQPLGGIASTGLWMLLVWLVPVLLTGLPDVVGAVSGMLVLIAVLATFFLSLLRLHRQMVEVKASELAIARDLYAQAYEPVNEARTLEALERQRGLLAAADALEKRASGIHEWPFAERTPTLVITITTSVIAMTIGRLILDPFGL